MTSEVTSVLDQLKGLGINDKDGSSKDEQSDDQKTTTSTSETDEIENRDVEFVMVPCDASKPMRNMVLPASSNTAGDSLPKFVKPYFADSRTIDVSLMKEQAQKTIASSSKQVQDLATDTQGNITAHSLNAVAAKGSVETFPLVRPASTNEYQGVYIYMDELGMLKKLPLNSRASAMAQACGYPSPNFYGDVFIGRVRTKPSMTNIPFSVEKDTDRGAEWMQRAPHENRAWHDTAKEIQSHQKNDKKKIYVDSDNKNDETNDNNDDGGGEAEMDWEQEDEELEIKIPFPNVDVIDKSKVQVSFLPKAIKVVYDGVDYLAIDPLWSTILAGDGCNTWTIEKPNTLVVTVEIADPSVAWPQLTL